VSFCCLPSHFILVMSSRRKRIITERRPLPCSTSTGMTALTTHFYSAPASSSLSDFDRGCVRMPTLAGWRRRWLRILRPKITPASPATATKSTTRPFTTHDWPVRSHYYYRLLRKCARVVCNSWRLQPYPESRRAVRAMSITRASRHFEDFVVVVVVLLVLLGCMRFSSSSSLVTNIDDQRRQRLF
jgi:hypothetical protein